MMMMMMVVGDALGKQVYPWDVVVTYASGLIFIDVRDGVEFGLHSVYETAFEPPPEDDPEDINGKRKLSQEATSIYQNFTQACLRKNSKSRLAKASGGAGGGAGAGAGAGSSGSTGPGGVAIEAHPFFSAEDSNYKAPASICYRYRKWQLDADTTIVCRHSLNAVSRKKGKEQLLSVFALNEFDLKATDWRKKCDAQRGAVMATELKNNGAKVFIHAVCVCVCVLKGDKGEAGSCVLTLLLCVDCWVLLLLLLLLRLHHGLPKQSWLVPTP